MREEGYDEGFAIVALGHALFAEERLEPAHGVPSTLWEPQRSESQNRGGHCERHMELMNRTPHRTTPQH